MVELRTTVTVGGVFFCLLANVLPNSNISAQTPYCGIYAVYGASVACGKSSKEFVELADHRFVGSRKGSTLAELISACSFLGVNATPLRHLSDVSLYQTQDPLVLHFSSYGQLRAYDHWVLFLGIEDGQAVVIDGGPREFHMPVSEVLLRWDGIAIAIHVGEKPKTSFSKLESKRFGAWIVACLCLAVSMKRIFDSNLGVSAISSFVVFALTGWLILFGSIATSLLTNHETLSYAMFNHDAKRFTKITSQELNLLLTANSNSVLLIDARYAKDYKRGTIVDSMNIPVDTNQRTVESLVQGMDRRKSLVVFCQSENCHFGEIVASKLSGEGFSDIKLYQPGWVGWRAYIGKNTVQKP